MSAVKIKILKSKIPTLWLDTGYIWVMPKSVLMKIAILVLKRKLILLDTGQLAEMKERYSNGSVKPTKEATVRLKAYETLVGEYQAVDHTSFQSIQIVNAMKAYINKDNHIIFKFEELFDSLLTSFAAYLDEISKIFSGKWGTSRNFKSISSSIVEDWKKLRIEVRREKITFKTQKSREILGLSEALKTANEGDNPVRWKNIVGHYLKKWKKVTGNEDIDKLQKFMISEYYKQIPYADIHSSIIADLMVGNETPRNSDYFDSVMIAIALPFTDLMVIDGAMRNRIKDTLKLVTPNGQFECALLLPTEVESRLESLIKNS